MTAHDESRREAGESLVEILLALVIIGLLVSAFAGAFITGIRSSGTHRDVVTVDGVLRDYAEATEAAVRAQCTSGSTFSVTYAPPANYTVNPLTGQACPPSSTAVVTDPPWSPIALTATAPNGAAVTLNVVVRTP